MLTRRRFLAQSAASAIALPLLSSKTQNHGVPLTIDAHVHVFERNARFPFAPAAPRANPARPARRPKIAAMMRAIISLACLLSCAGAWATQEKQPTDPSAGIPSFDYQTAYAHEIKPHRRTIPLAGVTHGGDQLPLALTVSPAGDVLDAKSDGEEGDRKFWPALRPEVLGWKFIPFEVDGRPVTASVREYIDLVPPERLPSVHVPAPAVRPDSKVDIMLLRSMCYGRCPVYKVSVSTRGIVFDGEAFVAAEGRHTDTVDPSAVRALAKKFVAADFYSMREEYRASVTDNSTYVLSIAIDGRKKQVVDYVGQWVGMPAAIVELEDDVDALAHTERWIKGPQQ
jgi:hypothetical protein